jgi:alpha-L-fucosidase
MPRPIPAWFRNARLGMFIHYGLYSLFGGNENEIRRQVGRTAYAKAIDRFRAQDADPEAWARLAAESGCSYLVLTAKHGEGFCLWPSRHTDCHVGHSPCGRDLVGETVAACRKHRLRVGIYFGPQTWISPLADDDRAGYRAMVLGMIDELMTAYGRIDLLWLDDSDEPRLDDATAAAIVLLARRRQPGIVVNDRGFPRRDGGMGDYVTPERFLPDRTEARHRPWEACDSIGVHSWGWHADERFWSSPELARRLATAAARGGRYLLNVQPEAGGRIRPECVERFQALGAWAAQHRRALSAGGCALVPRDPCDPARPALGVATAAPGRIHLLLERWPSADAVVVPHLGGKLRARLGATALRVTAGPDGLHLHGLPVSPPHAGPVEIVITGRARIDERARAAAELPVQAPGLLGAVVLDAANARCSAPSGVPLQHLKRLPDGRSSIGFFFAPGVAVEWAARLPRAGRWRVVARLARPATGEQAAFSLRVGRHRLVGETVPTASWDDPAEIDLGTVALPKGALAVRLVPERLARAWFADVHGVVLVPA